MHDNDQISYRGTLDSYFVVTKKFEKGNQPKHLMIRADQLWIDIMLLFCKSFRREIQYTAI